jgi:hypothetical protein
MGASGWAPNIHTNRRELLRSCPAAIRSGPHMPCSVAEALPGSYRSESLPLQPCSRRPLTSLPASVARRRGLRGSEARTRISERSNGNLTCTTTANGNFAGIIFAGIIFAYSSEIPVQPLFDIKTSWRSRRAADDDPRAEDVPRTTTSEHDAWKIPVRDLHIPVQNHVKALPAGTFTVTMASAPAPAGASRSCLRKNVGRVSQ